MVKRTFEEKQNLTQEDILQRLKTLSPFLQQEYLENILERFHLDPHIKVLASRRLADLYARSGMYASAAQVLKNTASIAPTYDMAKDLFMETGMMAVKSKDYNLAEDSFRKASDVAKPSEKGKVLNEAADIFLFEAEQLEKSGKMSRSVELYERILRQDREESTKLKIKQKLVVLYEKLGKIQESLTLRDSLK